MSYADDLRALADFYDANPGLPAPGRSEVVYLGGDDARKRLVQFLQTLPRPLGKDAGDHSYGITAKFGSIALRVYVPRNKACTQRQTGTRVIPATEERVEPVYEWTCPDSVLRDLA